MSTENSIRCVNINELIDLAKIPLICPICSSKKEIKLPKSIISKKKSLTTVSIPNEMVCEHHFQVFIDQNFKVRGYQKVDYTLKRKEKRNRTQETKNIVDNLIFKKNIVQYSGIPSHNHISPEYDERESKKLLNQDSINSNNQICNEKLEPKFSSKMEKQPSTMEKKKTLKDIYDEFWEYIDDENKSFQKFIRKDRRRR